MGLIELCDLSTSGCAVCEAVPASRWLAKAAEAAAVPRVVDEAAESTIDA